MRLSVCRTPANSLHLVSRAWQKTVVSTVRTRNSLRSVFPSRHETVPGDDVTQWQVGSLSDADSRRSNDVARSVTIVADPQATFGRRQIEVIVATASDAEGFRHPPGTTGQFGPIFLRQISHISYLNPSRSRHFLNSRQRLDSTKQHASRFALRFARHIQAIVIPIDEIHVCVAGWAEQDRVPQSLSGRRMGRGIFRPQIRLDLHYAGGETHARVLTHENLSEKSSRNLRRMPREKCPVQRLDLAQPRDPGFPISRG